MTEPNERSKERCAGGTSPGDVIREAVNRYLPVVNGYRDARGVWHEGSSRREVLDALDALEQETRCDGGNT